MRHLTAMLVLLASASAAAHGIDHPRRITLTTRVDRVEVVCEIEIAGPEADGMRRLFDRDRDGKLSVAERETFATYLVKRAIGTFTISRENSPIPLEIEGRTVTRDLDVAKASAVIGVRLTAAWNLWEGRRFTVRDGGDSVGHVPLVVVPTADFVRVDAPRTGPETYDLPAQQDVVVVLTPKK